MIDEKELEDKAISLAVINTCIDDSTSLNSEDSKSKTLLEVVKTNETLYGRDVKIKDPICIGGVFAFVYANNHPLIIIGPHCKLIII
jgi:hypothetical protein